MTLGREGTECSLADKTPLRTCLSTCYTGSAYSWKDNPPVLRGGMPMHAYYYLNCFSSWQDAQGMSILQAVPYQEMPRVTTWKICNSAGRWSSEMHGNPCDGWGVGAPLGDNGGGCSQRLLRGAQADLDVCPRVLLLPHFQDALQLRCDAADSISLALALQESAPCYAPCITSSQMLLHAL